MSDEPHDPGLVAPPSDRPTIPFRWLLLVGVLAGAASGLFGVGGGTIIVPGLVLLAGVPQKLATGTSLTAVIPIAAAAAYGYAASGEVDVQRGAWLCLGALAGTLVGTRLLRKAQDRWLQGAFALLLVVTAARMLAGAGLGEVPGELTVGGVGALVLLGVAAGVLAGLFGVGGGIIIVPALTIVGGLPVALAKGTSLLAIVPPAILGTVGNRSVGLTAVGPALVLGVLGMASASVASRLAVGMDPLVASASFGVFLLAIAARMALTARATPAT